MIAGRLRSWLSRTLGNDAVRELSHLKLCLYTRVGCHLCEDAQGTLQRARQKYAFAFEVLDVDARPDWVKQWGECVPVVTVNDKPRFRGTVNPVLLERLLDGEARKAESERKEP